MVCPADSVPNFRVTSPLAMPASGSGPCRHVDGTDVFCATVSEDGDRGLVGVIDADDLIAMAWSH